MRRATSATSASLTARPQRNVSPPPQVSRSTTSPSAMVLVASDSTCITFIEPTPTIIWKLRE